MSALGRAAARFAIVCTITACAVGVSDSLMTTDFLRIDARHVDVARQLRFLALLAQPLGLHLPLTCAAAAFAVSALPAMRSTFALFCALGINLTCAASHIGVLSLLCNMAEVHLERKAHAHVIDSANRQFYIALGAFALQTMQLIYSVAQVS